jgi:hypothetical protein
MQKEKSPEALFQTNIYKDPEPAKDSRACVKQKQAHISLGLLLLTFSGVALNKRTFRILPPTLCFPNPMLSNRERICLFWS